MYQQVWEGQTVIGEIKIITSGFSMSSQDFARRDRRDWDLRARPQRIRVEITREHWLRDNGPVFFHPNGAPIGNKIAGSDGVLFEAQGTGYQIDEVPGILEQIASQIRSMRKQANGMPQWQWRQDGEWATVMTDDDPASWPQPPTAEEPDDQPEPELDDEEGVT